MNKSSKLYDRLIQDYLHVHYVIIFLFPLHYVCFLIYFILFVGFVVLLFLILIIHLLIDTLNIQEALVFIQLKINKTIQSILHQFIFINMFNILNSHTLLVWYKAHKFFYKYYVNINMFLQKIWSQSLHHISILTSILYFENWLSLILQSIVKPN